MKHARSLAFAAAALGLLAGPALAQRSADTLRLPFEGAISTVDWHLDIRPEVEMIADAIFDGLIAYNEREERYEPLLAESWERIDPLTLRFKLRDDVTWHDGVPFSADDVVYTIGWLIDPETRHRQKGNWGWIAEVRKLDDLTVEIVARSETPHDLMRLAYGTQILPAHARGPLADKMDFRNNIVGTGMYRVVSLDSNAGIVLERNPDYTHGGAAKPPSNIGRVHVVAMPDAGARTAALLAGEIDLLRNAAFEEARALAADPRLEMTVLQSISYTYVALNARENTPNEALRDPRVRRAIMMAIDRDALQRARTGGEREPRSPKAMCWDFQAGCAYSAELPAYDPEAARALLAEAGYADGFDTVIHTFVSTRDYGTIVSGFLDRVGIRARVEAVTFPAYFQAQQEGRFEVLVAAWNAGMGPDSGATMGLFFAGDQRDLYHDAEVIELAQRSTTMMDEAARREVVGAALDKTIERSYIMPLSGIPIPTVHSADLVVTTGRNTPHAFHLGDLNWRD